MFRVNLTVICFALLAMPIKVCFEQPSREFLKLPIQFRIFFAARKIIYWRVLRREQLFVVIWRSHARKYRRTSAL
jgi:hypothetical protein